MRNRKSVVAAGLGAAALGFLLWRPGTVLPQNQEPAENMAQYRIVVGLTDTAPREWQGALSVSGGELASVTGWRFSPKDQADNSGKFQFTTKVGPLENQLL